MTWDSRLREIDNGLFQEGKVYHEKIVICNFYSAFFLQLRRNPV